MKVAFRAVNDTWTTVLDWRLDQMVFNARLMAIVVLDQGACLVATHPL